MLQPTYIWNTQI